MSITDRRSLAAATSILSSPVSVSATACPTSVMLTRCRYAYTVGPQLYRPATAVAGVKSSIRRPSELYSRSSWFVGTMPHPTGAAHADGGDGRCPSPPPGDRGVLVVST